MGVEPFLDDFKAKIEGFGKFKNHPATFENGDVGGIAIRIGVLFLNFDVGLGKGDVFVFARGEIVRAINVPCPHHIRGF